MVVRRKPIAAFRHFPQTAILPHPALSKGEGFSYSAVQVLSFGKDLGEASTKPGVNCSYFEPTLFIKNSYAAGAMGW